MRHNASLLSSVSLRTVLCLALALCSLGVSAGQNPDSELLERKSSEFESIHGECAAVLVESRDCRIVSIHNRKLAVERRFPPGSLMKPLSAAVLCDDGLSPDRYFTCRGHFIPADGFSLSDEKHFNLSHDPLTGKKSFTCSLYAGHGRAALRDALVRSCNVYFLNAAKGCPSFYEKLIASWVLNDPLLPGLAAGKGEMKEMPSFQKLSSAIGEGPGVLTSPLKIAQVYSALFEGTPLMEPYSDGTTRVRSEISFREETLTLIRSALAGTVKDGTLSSLRVPEGCRILGGKTGTSTDLRDKSVHHGWNALWLEKGGKRYLLVTFVVKGSGPKEAAALSSSILGGM